MYEGRMVFPQILEFLPRRTFDSCVRRYHGNRNVRSLTCRDQFLAMMFAQLTSRESLRDVETCLAAVQPKLFHAGFRGPVRRSTLADANHKRDWRIWQDLGLALIKYARRLFADDPLPNELKNAAYALDATVLNLSLTLFPWAHSQRDKAAVKLHTLLDLRGNIPCFLRISSTKSRDSAMLDEVPLEAGALYVMDRDFNDYRRLYQLHQTGAFFLVRGKNNLSFRCRKSRPVNRATGIRSDQTVLFRDHRTSRKYPDHLRRISYVNVETRRRFVFVTNHFQLPAQDIVHLYWRRWEIELFFKWVKQHLRIKHFLGNTPNAVKTQLWIAVSTYVLVVILKRELQIERSMSEILQILSVTIFEKTSIKTVLEQNEFPKLESTLHKQLYLFDL
ncbi:IS4 family transposase [Candidatus Saccharibacteria bacterium]|nr:IS4 family transposase [Candidatus Saccharibacteria bacterium]